MLPSLWKMPGDQKEGERADAPAPLLSCWQVRAAAGEPFAIIRVQNLQGSIPVGRDAWGRSNKPQPVLISSEVSLSRPFSTASQEDKVNNETVHYGNLSKTLLSGLESWSRGTPPKGASSEDGGGPSALDVFELLWVRMTGRVIDGSRRELPADQIPFLDATKLRSLSLTVHLPKASLLGSGVSLSTTACFKDVAEGNPLHSYSRSLRLHALHVPTLIGVNANERQAKQMVVADVELDRLDITTDIYPEIEKLIVEGMEASSFETLEALGMHLADMVLSDFRVGQDARSMRQRGWQVKIRLEKPIAVPFAECPSVEIKAGTGLPQ